MCDSFEFLIEPYKLKLLRNETGEVGWLGMGAREKGCAHRFLFSDNFGGVFRGLSFVGLVLAREVIDAKKNISRDVALTEVACAHDGSHVGFAPKPQQDRRREYRGRTKPSGYARTNRTSCAHVGSASAPNYKLKEAEADPGSANLNRAGQHGR